MLYWVIYYHCLSYVHPFFSGLSHFIKGAFYSDQAAKWGWRLFIILFHLSTRFISSRIWIATISDRVAFEERRFRIESHLKSDDFRSSRIWRATILYHSAIIAERLGGGGARATLLLNKKSAAGNFYIRCFGVCTCFEEPRRYNWSPFGPPFVLKGFVKRCLRLAPFIWVCWYGALLLSGTKSE